MSSEPKLLIVDQSLRNCDGHYLEYDVSVAQAAAKLGSLPTIAANASFDRSLLREFRVNCHFSKASDEVYRSGAENWARSLISNLPTKMRTPAISAAYFARRAASGFLQASNSNSTETVFGRELSRLIEQEHLSTNDHVLIHTLNFRELHSLVSELRSQTKLPIIHVVLRRDPTEPSARKNSFSEIDRIFKKLHCNSSLGCRMRFYADTESLSAVYNELTGGTVHVQCLPIPHCLPPLTEFRLGTRVSPFVATYLGNARTEKGFHLLPNALEYLRLSHLASGRLRFVIQANGNLSLEEARIASARNRLATFGSDDVQLLLAPLSVVDFHQRIMEADLILLPYDVASYRRRSSGILVQALACGRPVVVPAGTWLSEVSPAGGFVTYDKLEDLGPAIATAIDNLSSLQAAAMEFAPEWRERHNADRLVLQLLAS